MWHIPFKQWLLLCTTHSICFMVGSFPIKYVCVCFIQNSCHNHFSPQTHSVTCSNRNMKWKIRVSGLWCTAVHKRFIFFILSGNERFNKKEPVTRSEIIKFWVYFLLNHLWFARRFYGFCEISVSFIISFWKMVLAWFLTSIWGHVWTQISRKPLKIKAWNSHCHVLP